MHSRLTIAVALLVIGCSSLRSYTLVGQVLAIDQARNEITIRHQEVSGFMRGMTMPFKVRDAALLGRTIPGDLVTATLVVSDTESYLTAIVRTGRAPLPEAASPIPATNVLGPGALAPDTEFTDESGAHRRLSDWRGKALAITFIYTRCPLPDFCPRMNRHFAAVQSAMKVDPGLTARVHLVSISLDPDFDGPDVLATEARRVGADPAAWTFLTGERQALDRFGVQFGVYVVRNGKNLSDITHNLRTAVISADGRVQTVLSGSEWSPSELLAALRRGE